MSGYQKIENNLLIEGNITITGTVDGRDVATDGSSLDSHIANTSNPHSVTASEVGLGNVVDLKVKLDATVSPGINDDSSGGYAVGSRWIDINNNKEYVCVDASVGAAVWVDTTVGADGGENNTASNIGTGGVGVFKQKSGVDLQFKKINAGSSKITVADDTGDDEIDIDLVESNIVIGNLSGAPSGDVVGTTDSQTLTNKTMNADNNTVSNIADAEIKTGAAINATKIAGGTVSNTEYGYLDGVTSGIQTQLDGMIPFSETNLINLSNGSPGGGNHIQFKITKSHGGSDDYNLGIDSDPVKIIFSAEDGMYRQATVMSADTLSSTATIFGVSSSMNSGSNWNPRLAISQDGNVGIGKSSASEVLDVSGNIAVSGTVDGRDLDVDGSVLDSHVAGVTGVHGISGLVVGTIDSQTLTNKMIDADNNTVSNIADAEIKSGAGIDASKISGGTVSNTEFDYLNGVTSGIQSQLDSKSGTGHTHTASNITDFNSSVDTRISLQAGATNGLATLDGSGKVPTSQLDLDSVDYQGTWNASTNSPLVTGGTGTKGHYYVVSFSGSTNIDGVTDWDSGDWIIFNGTVWEKSDHTDQVTSVAGKQGAVVLAAGDIASGTFAEGRISESSVTQHVGALAHQSLSGAGTNTHAQIDSHLGSTSNPHSVTKSQVGLGNVDNTSDSSKPVSTSTQTALDGKEDSFSKNTAFNKNFGTSAGTVLEGDHSGATGGVHGVVGPIIGAVDVQTLTNKTLTAPTVQNNLITTNSYFQLADISAPSNPGSGLGRLYKKTGDDGIFWKPDASGPEIDLTGSAGAEANTASNVGNTGIGLFKQKNGIDLEFKNIRGDNAIKLIVSGNIEHCYEFEDDVTDGCGSQNGTIAGGVTYATGKVGPKAARFDGVSGTKINIGVFDINPTEFSISCWFKVNTFGDDRLVCKAYGESTSQHIFALQVPSSGGVAFRLTTGSVGTGTQLNGNTDLSTGVWYHYIAWYDGANYKIYIDGTEDASASKTGTVPQGTGYDVAIGNQNDDGIGDRAFDGDIDQLIFWNKALSVDEITALYNAGSGSPTSNYLGGDVINITLDENNINHDNMSGAGTNTHSQIDSHLASTSNPHSVTASQVGLGNVDNTSDTNKPISSATQTALDGKEDNFSKNTAFNKNFGTVGGTVLEGNHAGATGGVHGVVGPIVGEVDAQTLTNKTINADNNTVSNIADAEIKTGAGINAAKISGGTVSNTEFDYLNGVTSGIQGQIDGKSATVHTHTKTNITDFTEGDYVHVTGNETVAGVKKFSDRIVANDEGYATTYALSVQKNNTNAYIEILNNGGTNKGAFFGLEGNQFTLYNWQGGDIEYWVDTVASSGNTKFTMQNDGVFRIHDLTAGVVKSNATGQLSVESINGDVVGTTGTQILTNKTINTASNTLVVAAGDVSSGTFADARISESSVTQHVGAINHDSLLGFVANEHIDHSTVSINGGVGLSGGGTIAATRTIDLDVNSLTADATPDGAADYVVTYDSSAGGHKKVLVNDLVGVGEGENNTGSNVGTAGVGVFKQKSGVNFEFKKINSGSSKISIVDDTGDDEIDIDVVEGNIVIGSLSGAPSGTVVGTTDSQTLTNKTIDADNNTVSNIADAEIKTGAGINAAKISGGTVSNTEFDYLDGVTSGIQGQLDSKSASGHTHVAANITDFNSSVDTRISLQAGAADGLATLDSGGKVPASQLDLDSVDYQGTWNASTNSPTITGGTGAKGHYYVVGVSGSTNIDGITDWDTGDWIIFNGTIWEKSDHTDQVTSVAGKQGAVVLAAGDIASGTFADGRISESSVTQHVGALVHQSLSGAGTNTHAQIDSHLASTSNPHSVTASQVGLGNVDNTSDSSKPVSTATQTALDGKEDSFSKNTAFNKNFGTSADTVLEGDHSGATGGVHGVVGPIVGEVDAQTLTNKTINADNNTLSNIADAEVKDGAAINATKIGGGGVSNTEFGYLDGVTSSIQSQLNTRVSGPVSAVNNTIPRYDNTTGKLIKTSNVLIDDSNDLTIGTSESGAIYANKELILRQDGDTYGPSILRLRNRTGENGAIFETTDPTITLVDFIFKDASDQRNIRYESRDTSEFISAPEFQIGTAADPTLVINDTQILVRGNIDVTGTVDGRDIAADGGVLDAHVADATLHRVINDAGTSATELWSASKLDSELALKTPIMYDAIVAASGGDYTLPSAAFDSGHKTVFMRDGNYSESTDVIVPDGGCLVGESMDQAIITFTGGYSVKSDGNTGIAETTGTVSLTNGSKTVTGSGTTFTNLNPLDGKTYFIVNHNAYPIASVTNNTSLELGPPFKGASISGSTYRAQKMNSSVSMAHFTIVGSTGTGLFTRALRHSVFEDIVCRNCALGTEILDSVNCNFSSLMMQNGGGIGFSVNNTASCNLTDCQAFNSSGVGYNIAGTSSNVILDSCQASNGGSHGLNITGSSKNITVDACIFNNNLSLGINVDPGTNDTSIAGCIMRMNGSHGIDYDGVNNTISKCVIDMNGGYGVQAGNSGVISANQITSNGNHGINMNGDNQCCITGNIIRGNSGIGIWMDSDNNVISGNHIRDNTSYGIHITNTSRYHTITGNNIHNNSSDGIHVDTTSTYNKISGNTISSNTIGVNILTGCNNTTISNNTCRANSSHGISVAANTCIVNGNRCESNTGDGCKISDGATDVTVFGNNFQSNTGTDFNDLGDIVSLEGILINSVDSRSATTLALGSSIATKVEIADTGVITEIQGNLDALSGVDVTGNITVTGTVDGRDVATDGGVLDSHVAGSSGVHGVSGSVVGTTDTQTLTNKTINTASNNLVVAAGDVSSGTFADARIAESNVTQHEGAINHDSLLGFVTNEHIDHSTVSVNAGVGLSGGGTIAATRTIDLDVNSLTADASPDGAADYVVTYDASASGHKKVLVNDLVGVGAGENNTGSNVGTAGVGVFKQKSGVNFEFKKINAGSSKVTVVDDTGNNEVDIDVVESNIVIGNLSGAPTGTVVGTTDSQTLTNKTLTSAVLSFPQINDTSADHQYVFAVSELVADRTVTLPLLTGNDTFVFEGHSQTLTNKTINTASNTLVVAAGDVTSGTFADARISESSVTQHEGAINHDNLVGFVANEHIDHSSVSVNAGIGLTGGGTIAETRTIDLDINSLTADASPDRTSDYVVTYDASAGGHKKVLLNNLSGETVKIGDFYDNTGGQTFTGLTTINIDTSRKNTGEFSLSNDEVTVNHTDTFLIIFHVSTDVSSGASVSASSAWLEIDTGGGYSEVDGSRGYMYNRQLNTGVATCTKQIVMDVTSGDKFKIQATRHYGSSTITTIADASGISFVSLNSTGVVGPMGPTGPADGEVNTASNVGVGGVGVFKQKNVYDLQFKSINSASSKISVVDDTGNNEIDIDIVEGNVNHDNLLGFVANEHIDHTSVSVNAGVGLSGGGTIAANRTIDLDVNSLTVDGSPDGGADYVATYDASAGSHKKVLLENIPISKAIRQGHTWAISGEVQLPSGDENFLIPFFVSLASGQTAKVVSARHRINSGTSVTAKVQKNDVDVTGFSGISITTTSSTTDPSDVSVADGDKLALVVTAVSGTPKNMTFTLFLEHTV